MSSNILAEAQDTVEWFARWGNDTCSDESFSPYKILNTALLEYKETFLFSNIRSSTNS